MNARLIVARQLDCPAATVFPALIGLASQSRWIVATTLAEVPGGPRPPYQGAQMVARTGLGPVSLRDTMRITEFSPPRRWAVEHIGRVVRGTGIFGVLPSTTRSEAGSASGCRVFWAEEMPLPFGAIGRLGWLILRPLVRAGIALSLRRLERGLADGTLPAAQDPTEYRTAASLDLGRTGRAGAGASV